MKKNFSKYYIHKKFPYLELRHSNSGKHYKKHLHESFSIGANLKGISLYTNKNKSYNFSTNMLAIINPLDVHSCNCKEEHEFYMLYLDKTWSYNLQKSINPLLKEFKNFSFDLIKNKELYKEFISLCKIIFEEEFHLKKEQKLIEFLVKLFLLNNEKEEEIKKEEKLDKILKYLEKNYKENISLFELSEKFKLNSFYIIREFKKQFNLSPHQYLLNLKINRAKDFLKKGYSIVDTALECGFVDQSHFHRNFVQLVANTPKEFQVNFIQ